MKNWIVLVTCGLFIFTQSVGKNADFNVYPPDLQKTGKIINKTTIYKGGYRIKKVVIDAGHGGKDDGCSGRYHKEKNITLAIALKLGKLIEKYFPEVTVIYTRDSDEFIPLYKRADIANKNKADLFISVHCNSVASGYGGKGTETYVLGLHRQQDNFEVAKRENEAILLEEDYQKNYDGFDPNSTEGYIMLTNFQSAYLEKSTFFANNVESQLKDNAGRTSRGVKQAGFLVLRETAMPSVLIETGYLSNPSEEKYLNSTKGQSEIAESVLVAFQAFKNALEEDSDDRVLTGKENVSPSDENDPQDTPSDEPKAVQASLNTQVPVSNSTGLQFKVQLAASANAIDTKTGKWNNIRLLEVSKEDNMYKYLAGSFATPEEADAAKKNAKGAGFPDAFVVAYKNGKRIKMEEARKLLINTP